MSRGSALVLALLAAVVIVGCHRGRSARGIAPTVPRALARIARITQPAGCARVDQVLYVLPAVVQVRGCGQRHEYLLLGRGRTPSPITTVEIRAAVQMGCPQDQLAIESPAPAVRAVSGCGRRARYDLLCNEQSTHCTWSMTAHAGRWALVAIPDVPEQFDVGWALPPGVDAEDDAAQPATRQEDLEHIALPPPPGEETASDEAPFIPPPPADE